MRSDEYETEIADAQARVIEGWNPPEKPHCSNCRYCIVSGTPTDTRVHCAMGYGREQALWVVIRPIQSRQFKTAKDCESFDSMGE